MAEVFEFEILSKKEISLRYILDYFRKINFVLNSIKSLRTGNIQTKK